MDKFLIKLNTVEDGDLEMIGMITKVLEDYFYNFVSFDQKVEICKEEQYFVLQILNKESGEQDGAILFNPGDGLEKPSIFWDYEIGFHIYFEKERSFESQLEENFLKALRKFKDCRDEI